MRSVRIILSLFHFFLLVANLSAEELLIDNVTFQPQEFFVGDRVILTIRLTNAGESELSLPDLPFESDGFLVESIDVAGSGGNYDVDIVFRSFIPGSAEFPSLSLGSFKLKGLTVFTTPLVDKGLELRSLRTQMALPGTRLYSGLFIIFLLSLPFLLFFSIKFFVRTGKQLVTKYHRKKPYRRFQRVMKKLDSGMQQWDNKTFFIMLTEGFKSYLTDKTGFDFNTATTAEIGKKQMVFFSESEFRSLINILKLGDLVKFAGEELPGEGRKNTLGEVLVLVEDLEQKEVFDADI